MVEIDGGVEKQITLPNYNMLDELRNICIKIPLLQSRKEIPIFAKTIKELGTQILGRKKKDVKNNSISRENCRHHDGENNNPKISISKKPHCKNSHQWNRNTKHTD